MILVFTSFDVGGHPFRVAGVLRRHGVEASFLSLGDPQAGHDSRAFHYGSATPAWDLSAAASPRGASRRELVAFLAGLRGTRGVTWSFATGRRSGLLAEAGIPYHYWSFGSDLDQECFGPLWPPGYPAWRRPWAMARHAVTVRREARAAVRGAGAVMIAPYQAADLARVAPGKPLFFLPHLLEPRGEVGLQTSRDEARAAIGGEIGADRFLFSSARHVWTEHYRGLTDHKGNDILLRAFALLARSRGFGGTRLVLVDKGPDAGASRRLAAALGIADRVTWIAERPRPQLEPYYLGASLCFGQFGNPVVTYAALEPLSLGTPCVTSLPEAAGGVPFYREPPPLLGARTPEEVAGVAAALLGDPEALRDVGLRGLDWVSRNCSEEAFVRAFLELLRIREGR